MKLRRDDLVDAILVTLGESPASLADGLYPESGNMLRRRIEQLIPAVAERAVLAQPAGLLSDWEPIEAECFQAGNGFGILTLDDALLWRGLRLSYWLRAVDEALPPSHWQRGLQANSALRADRTSPLVFERGDGTLELWPCQMTDALAEGAWIRRPRLDADGCIEIPAGAYDSFMNQMVETLRM